jgi:hypothetical protein
MISERAKEPTTDEIKKDARTENVVRTTEGPA